MRDDQLSSGSFRWLLRVLCDAPFLRLYIDAAEHPRPLSLEELEHLFFHALPADHEHLENQRADAWKHLHGRFTDLDDITAPLLFHRLYGYLHEHHVATTNAEHLHLPATYGLDFLFRQEPPVSVPALDGYVETHAHLRGSVPQATHWQRLMGDARLRAVAVHRKDLIQVGTWKRTRADLLRIAHQLTACVPLETALSQLLGPSVDANAVALLAIRANFGRHLTVQRGKHGLTDFTLRYNRFSDASMLWSASLALSRAEIEHVVATLDQFHRSGVHAIELRPVIGHTRIDQQKKLRQCVLAYFCHIQRAKHERIPPVRLGLVVSLFKQAVSSQRAGHTIDGSVRATWVAEQILVWKRQIRSFLDVLETVPPLRLFIVGLDGAGREQGCPVRDFADVFALIHDYHRRHGLADHTPGRRLAPWLHHLSTLEYSPGKPALPPEQDFERQLRNAQVLWEHLCADYHQAIAPIRLGLTMHAGEDFCDPVTGLREIWDAVEHLRLRPGDRLGHALAAGLNDALLTEFLEHRAAASSHLVGKLPKSARGYRLAKPIGVHLLDEAWRFQRYSEANATDNRPSDLLLTAARAFAIPAEAPPWVIGSRKSPMLRYPAYTSTNSRGFLLTFTPISPSTTPIAAASRACGSA